MGPKLHFLEPNTDPIFDENEWIVHAGNVHYGGDGLAWECWEHKARSCLFIVFYLFLLVLHVFVSFCLTAFVSVFHG